jgi:hypothetical protein
MPKITSSSETQDTYYWKHRDKILMERKKRYQENEAYREATRRRARERYHSDKEYRAATYRRALERYYHLKAQAQTTPSESQKTQDERS